MKYPQYEELIVKHGSYSQPLMCLDYLMYHERTSPYELREKFGFLDPAKQISVLKTAYGVTIYKRNIQVIDRFGRKVRTKEYSLEQLEGFAEDLDDRY